MKLAMFSYGLPSEGEKRGGIERAAHTLAQGLAERGHQIVVFSHDARPEGSAYAVRELPWKAFVATWLGRRVTMGYLGNVLALLPDYREFDAIIAHGDSLLLPLKGQCVVRVMHGSALDEARHATSIGRRILQMGVYGQELLTALAVHDTVAVSGNTRRANPFVRYVIPHGVDGRIFHPAPEEKTGVPSIVFVGTLGGRKRGRFLLDVFSRVIRVADPDAQLHMVGPRGPATPGVTYYTGVSDQELSSLYRRAWVYASPSAYEGFGLPYLEAMACGTAVVATPNPGSREVLDEGRYGLMAEDAAFGGAILDVLVRHQRRQELETAGLSRAGELSLDVMLDRYETLLEKVCHAHGRSAVSA